MSTRGLFAISLVCGLLVGGALIASGAFGDIYCTGGRCDGNAQNNTMVGTPGYDNIFGYGGADQLSGNDSGDDETGGNGNDIISGGGGDDTLTSSDDGSGGDAVSGDGGTNNECYLNASDSYSSCQKKHFQ
jgi:hypothetical protein